MTHHWQDSHFGLDDGSDFGPRLDVGPLDVGTHDSDPVLTDFDGSNAFDYDSGGVGGGTEFGLEPVALLTAAAAGVGLLGTVAHFFKKHRARRTAAAHGHAQARSVAHVASPPAAMHLTDSDGTYEALQVAASSDPYALGQPL